MKPEGFEEWLRGLRADPADMEAKVPTFLNFARAAYIAGMRAAAEMPDRLAEMMEQGAGESSPGRRLRQAAELIRKQAAEEGADT